MSKIASVLGEQINDEIERLRERNLLEAAMATSALVAMADRRVLLEESLALGSVVENAELLHIEDPRTAVDLYADYVERLREDFESGRREALDVISRCSDDLYGAELLVKVGIAIAKADDEFCREELDMVEEICGCLGISGLDPLAIVGPMPVNRPN